MLNTLGAEGGKFVAHQAEVTGPTLNTVNNITETLFKRSLGDNDKANLKALGSCDTELQNL